MGKAKPNAAPAEAETSGNVTSISAARPKSGTLVADAAAKAKAATDASLVVFGRDDAAKPHASWFGAAEAELATKAAGIMRFKVLPITTDEHRAAASGLPQGRVFASGRCFSPFCREAACAALEAFSEAFAPPPPAEPEPTLPPRAITGTPQRWEDIGLGSMCVGVDEYRSGLVRKRSHGSAWRRHFRAALERMAR